MERRWTAREEKGDRRFLGVVIIFALLLIFLVFRLAYLQIIQYGLYALYAADEHTLEKKLLPVRGSIYVHDRDGSLHPIATQKLVWQIYAVPREIKNPAEAAKKLASIIGTEEVDLLAKLQKPNDPYELLVKEASSELVDRVRELNVEGMGYVQRTARMYPEKGLSGQLVGFVRDQEGMMKGQYGVEGSFDRLLAGTPGSLFAEKDASGRQLIFGQTKLQEAQNGADVVLTIDRTIQYEACSQIQAAVQEFKADQGSIIIMDPKTGAIIALCSSPNFESTEYSKVDDLKYLNNAVLIDSFEPGSTFKAFTMAAGINAEKINPHSTYEDKEFEEIDDFKIRNSDHRAHGVVTMSEALAESYNLGTIYVQRLLGRETFQRYVESFGFGKKTDVGLTPESKGDISALAKKGKVFAATASYGQGISVTSLQLLTAFGALANGGKLMRPYITEEIRYADGRAERTKPEIVSTPIKSRTSVLLTGMLINVVENGHGKKAGVPGYWVAGKTGTAQVAKKDGPGYDDSTTIGSFAGYAPAQDPKFVMLVKIDRPHTTWAESSAAPVFGKMAAFLLNYYHIPPERQIVRKRVEVPKATTSTTSTVQ